MKNNLPQISGIYKILCLANGRFYVGSSVDVHQRVNEHTSELSRRIHGNVRLQNSYNKYGPDAFEVSLLQACSRDALRKVEQVWLDVTQAYDRKIGFNLSNNAFYGSYEVTDEIRKKISENTKLGQNLMSPEARDRMIAGSVKAGKSRLGKTKTEAFKQKRREIMLNSTHTCKAVKRSDGMMFRSVVEAADHHGVNRVSMRNWCNGKPIKNVELRKFTFSYVEG